MPDGSGYTNLYQFSGPDGSTPGGGVLYANHVLYGSTTEGGDSNGGTLFALQLPPAPNLLLNGSFENHALTDEPDLVIDALDTNFWPGWATTEGGAEFVQPGLYRSWGSAADGEAVVDLAASPNGGGIQQTFPTTPGMNYVVSFSLGSLVDDGRSGSATVQAAAAGFITNFTFSTASTTLEFTRRTFRFTASTARTTLSFATGDSDGTRFVVIDDVTVLPYTTGNLIQNPGFESGFANWTLTSALGGPTNSRAGRFDSYGAQWDESADGDSISQTVPTVAGQNYEFRFWLAAPFAGDPCSFVASWDGIPQVQIDRPEAFPFKEYYFLVTASGPATTISFQGFSTLGSFVLDDVSVGFGDQLRRGRQF